MDWGQIWNGLVACFGPKVIVYQLLAVMIGLIFGILPGLAGISLLAILIPLTWRMGPVEALSFLIAGYAVCYTGGAITAILLNVPGTGPNAATTLDGFPLTRQGKAGKALGAALTASGLGGVFGAIALGLLIPVVFPFVMAFGAPECFVIIFLGLSMMAVFGRESVVKTFLAGLMGILVSCFGYHSGTGVARFTFGSVCLLDGIKVIPCALGIFAVPEMLSLIWKRESLVVAEGTLAPSSFRDVIEGIIDVFRHFGLFVRSTIVGLIVGLIPGVGGDVAVWMAYGQAKATSRNPDTFGKGNIEGVIAPESANNAKEGGGLLPTIALGIPGSSAMAIFLGALLVHGIQPGPTFLKDHLDLAFTMVGTLAMANLIGAALCVLFSPYLVKVTRVKSSLLVPMALSFIAIGAFSARNAIHDVFIMFVFSLLGWAFREFGYSRPAFFLGFVLGGLAEKYLSISLAAYGWAFIFRPLPAVLIALIAFILVFNQLKRFAPRRKSDEKG